MLNCLFFSFLFGAMTKVADLYNEHGFKEPFRGASLLSGLLWGLLGAYLIKTDENLAVFYLSLILYWIFRIKLDFRNHAVGGLLMILAAVKFFPVALSNRIWEIIAILAAYSLTRYLYEVIRYDLIKKVLKFRLVFIPLFISFFFHNFSILLASLSALVGIFCVNRSLFLLNKKSKKI